MRKLIKSLLLCLGVSLWLPGIAVLTIGESWGLQLATLFSLALLGVFVLIQLDHVFSAKPNHLNLRFLFVHFIFFVGSLCSTIFSTVGITRSIQTFGTEMIGLALSFSISWAFLILDDGFDIFLKGFRFAGAVSAGFAIYQAIGFRIGLPFSYIPLNNPSFSLLDIGSAIGHARAFAFTPEPSILASLLFILAGLTIIDIQANPKSSNRAFLGVILLGFAATGSQSLLIFPVYLFVALQLTKLFWRVRYRIRWSDLRGVLLLVCVAAIVFLLDPSLFNTISRISDIGATANSATWRLNDVYINIEMLRRSPAVGMGLGAQAELASIVKESLGLEGNAGATSGLFRMLAEQGLTGLAVTLTTIWVLLPKRYFSFRSRHLTVNAAKAVLTILGVAIGQMFFVGYRNVYHMWLLIPMGIYLKSVFDLAHTEIRRSKPLSPPIGGLVVSSQ